ncbi:MAG: hypothetical protein AB7O69_09755 [Burkholderiales bacterium]
MWQAFLDLLQHFHACRATAPSSTKPVFDYALPLRRRMERTTIRGSATW